MASISNHSVCRHQTHCALHITNNKQTLTRLWYQLAVSCVSITFKPVATHADIVCWAPRYVLLTFFTLGTTSITTICWHWGRCGTFLQTRRFTWNKYKTNKMHLQMKPVSVYASLDLKGINGKPLNHHLAFVQLAYSLPGKSREQDFSTGPSNNVNVSRVVCSALCLVSHQGKPIPQCQTSLDLAVARDNEKWQQQQLEL